MSCYLNKKAWLFTLAAACILGGAAGGQVTHAATSEEAVLPFTATNMHANATTTESANNRTMGSTLSTAALKATISDAGSTSKLHYLRMPAGLPESEISAWTAVAKQVASEDQKATGRAQEIVMVDATVATITIGSSNIPSVDAVDVASYQSWMTQTDYNKLASLGVKTVVVKINQGDTYQNPYASQSIKMAQKAGLQVAVYDYTVFNSAASAKSEAAYAAKTLVKLGLPKTTLVFADMEDTACVGKYLTNYWQALSAQGYTNHGVYTGGGYSAAATAVATVGKDNTWWAQYPYTPSASSLWDSQYGAWQFSSNAVIPTSPNQRIDVSHDYNGLLTEPNTSTGGTGAPAQGPWIAANEYVTVTHTGYPVYASFNFNVAKPISNYYHHTYHVTGQYYHANGSHYLSLYDQNGKWVGYINANGVDVGAGAQGKAFSDNRYVTITHTGYPLYSGFDWQVKQTGSAAYHKTYHTKALYYHLNGNTYLSLYDQNNKWAGYINAKGVEVGTGAQGPHFSDNRYVTITHTGYPIYSGFDWQVRYTGSALYHHTYHSTGLYYHLNGNTYLSLYDAQNRWIGYINANGVNVGSGPQGAHLNDDRRVEITHTGYPLYSNFNWVVRHTGASVYHQVFRSTGIYHYINGNIYLSLYNDSGTWEGYINANGVAVK